jgi:hypothetical protein
MGFVCELCSAFGVSGNNKNSADWGPFATGRPTPQVLKSEKIQLVTRRDPLFQNSQLFIEGPIRGTHLL